jgi:hypothetical protein
VTGRAATPEPDWIRKPERTRPVPNKSATITSSVRHLADADITPTQRWFKIRLSGILSLEDFRRICPTLFPPRAAALLKRGLVLITKVRTNMTSLPLTLERYPNR